ncbi:hypothetical protein E2320_002452, partial [Naja naja]
TVKYQTYGNIPYIKIAIMPALNKPATGTVTNQARKILRKRCQSTAFLDRIQPTATTEPTLETSLAAVTGQRHTLQCVVLTGSPILEAITTVNAEANSIVKPLQEA